MQYIMSNILYYSNYCEKCKELLQNLANSHIQNDIHFICLDSRVKKKNTTYIQFENGIEIELPDCITCVPSLIILNRGNMMITGNKVKEYLLNKHKELNMKATKKEHGIIEGEPNSFSLHDFGNIHSDSFSYLDQTSEELSAVGHGGTRQLHNYVPINQDVTIETMKETYDKKQGKIGEIDLQKLQQQREMDIPKHQQQF